MLPQPVVLGYHGCTRALARRVVSDEIPLRPSENDYDWLGHGIYFWATDASRAMVWAQSRVSELGPVAADPVVLGAAIELGNCLQLADVRAVAYLREAYKELKLASDQENVQLPRNTGKFFSNRKLDCAV